MKTATIAVFISFVCAATGAHGQTVQDRPRPRTEAAAPATAAAAELSLAEVLAAVRGRNPDLKAASAVSLAYKNRIKQAYLLKDPVIEFERMYTPSGKSFLGGDGERNISVSQMIDNPYKLLLRRDLAKDEHAFYSTLYEAKELELISKAKALFYEYYMASKAELIYNETVDILRGFSKIAEAKYSVGNASQSDAIKAQVELSKTLNLLVTVTQEKETAKAMLNALMDRDTLSPLPAPQELEPAPPGPAYEKLRSAALASNPGLKAYHYKISQAERRLSLSKADYLPDFMLLYRKRKAPGSEMNNTYDISLGLTVPLWFSKQGAMVKETAAEKEMAHAEYRAARNELSSSLREADIKAGSSLRLVELYRASVIPQAEEALKIAQSGYQAEKTDFMDLLDAQRTLLEFRMDYYRYVVDYQTWLARVVQLTGEIK
ncbi:MAG: TolC family protein [Elusimicrobia bacterium]|nr:TolC family protein [Elusimicrobiota bacterium]